MEQTTQSPRNGSYSLTLPSLSLLSSFPSPISLHVSMAGQSVPYRFWIKLRSSWLTCKYWPNISSTSQVLTVLISEADSNFQWFLPLYNYVLNSEAIKLKTYYWIITIAFLNLGIPIEITSLWFIYETTYKFLLLLFLYVYMVG